MTDRLRRDDDPARWLELTYGADAVITQVDDGHPDGPGLAGAMQTSSASAPDIVAIMLAELDAHPGHRVLEIGTGTGYNAALLAHRLGAEHITSIEVDPDVAAQARQALSDTGYGEIRVVTGDGALGYPPGARYDRVIATAAVRAIPYPWVEQTRPGGRIVLPWANSYTGALVALTVEEHGSASGGIVGESSFMWLRAQRERRAAVGTLVDNEDHAEVHLTQLHPYSVGGEPGARFAIGQRVHQHGPRRLWDEIDAAHQWWVAHDKPDVDRWRFTVTRHAQRIELT